MRDYSLSHLSDAVLLRDLNDLIRKERVTVADMLAHIAEVDGRRLYAPAGFPSMFAYCVGKLRFSEDAAGRRIHAARAARQFPVLFEALADGRLHMTAVCLLAPHLTRENVDELVELATHRKKSEIEDLLAARCPQPTPTRNPSAQCELAPEPSSNSSMKEVDPSSKVESPAESERAPDQVEPLSMKPQHAPEHVAIARPLPSPPPVCQVTLRQSTREKARYALALLSHAMPSGDLSDVLDRALDLLITETKKRRLGAGARRPARRRNATAGRTIPTQVRHAVWERDGGRCTFVGTDGHRCNSDELVQFDHVDPRHRENTVAGLRLRCRTHNQLEAERVFGAAFMARKREKARLAVMERRAKAQAQHAPEHVDT